MKRIIFWAGVLLPLPGSAQIHSGLGAYPMKAWFNGGPGQVQTQVVHLVNTSSDTLRVGAFLKDWDYDSLGNTLFYSAGALPLSCAGWVRLSTETQFALAPGEDKAIQVSIVAPAAHGAPVAQTAPDAHGARAVQAPVPVHTAMLLFQQLNPMDGRDSRGMAIKVAIQIGIKLYHSAPGAADAAVEIKSFKEDTQALRLVLANTGSRLVDGEVKCSLVNQKDGQRRDLDKVAFYTLPGDKRVLSFKLPKDLPVGHYLVTGLVDSEALDEVQAAELETNL